MTRTTKIMKRLTDDQKIQLAEIAADFSDSPFVWSKGYAIFDNGQSYALVVDVAGIIGLIYDQNDNGEVFGTTFSPLNLSDEKYHSWLMGNRVTF